MSTKRIQFAAPGPLDGDEESALREAAARVIRSDWYVLGPEVLEFEESWTSYVGATGSIGVASGLDALEISLRSLGVGSGDEVIVPAVSAMATALAVARAGAQPVFCDIVESTALLDIAHADSLISSRTKAVIPVHLYGRAVDMPTLCEWANRRGLFVIEDAAQAHGAAIGSRRVGTWGDLAAFSFYPTKNLGALGDAGAITSRDALHLDQARVLRNYGQRGQYNHELLGLNSRLDELQAALLSVRLRYLDARNSERQEVAKRYFSEINANVVTCLSAPLSWDSYVAHLFVVRTAERQRFLEHMNRVGIDCLVHYPVALPDQPVSTEMSWKSDEFPNARRHAASCVSLPCRPGLSDSDVQRIIEAVNGFCA